MKKSNARPLAPRPDLDFSNGVRGKYSNQLREGINLAIIDPALHTHFPDSESVSSGLRALLAIQQELNAATAPTSKRDPQAA
jgi:hypothetical protein